MVNQNNFISINEVLADVTVALDDKEERKLSHGFYIAQVRNAIDELGFSTVFLEDSFDREIPVNHIISVPSNVYRIKNLQVFNGTPDEITAQANVYWKKGARSLGGHDKGYTANMISGSSDLYYSNSLSTTGESAYWFVYNNGNIILSDASDAWDYLRVTYDGIPSGNLDDIAMLPPEIRKAVMLWTIAYCSGFLKIKNPSYRVIQMDAEAKLDEFGMGGAWHEAKSRLKYMGKKFMRDVLTYSARPHAT